MIINQRPASSIFKCEQNHLFNLFFDASSICVGLSLDFNKIPAAGFSGRAGSQVPINTFALERIFPQKPEAKGASKGGKARISACWKA